MRAIMVLFDTLNRRYLPPYGARGIHAPNFERLAKRTVTFDNCYGGSMPCMPARREIHTGRHNFLHRSWGPLEPFDDSVPEMLSGRGIYTHLVTDHQHYWEDGGATYHNRYDSYEFFRGQEGDRWKGQVADPQIPDSISLRSGRAWRQDWVNRQHYANREDHPQTLTVDAGLGFLETNAAEDEWFLQIECFDPHEPFVSYDEHRSHYVHEYEGDHFDWPDYRRVVEGDATVEHLRLEYAALLTMCDQSLGRVLDFMDEQAMWDDTMLIVCTDHGLLLGEHGWWGKNAQPWYDENIHTPLFVWDPRSGIAGVRRDSLVQTIDLGPTLLEFFGVDQAPDMRGRPLADVITSGAAVREGGLFGSFGGHVNVTDGRYVYMRAPVDESNAPLFEYTLMPTHMASRYAPAELRGIRLVEPLPFTKQVPVLEIAGAPWGNPFSFGTLLFDLERDPEQVNPIVDDEIELRLASLLVTAMRDADAPTSQFDRLGLPSEGPVAVEHLLCAAQHERAVSAMADFPREDEFADGVGVNSTVSALLDIDGVRDELIDAFPMLRNPQFALAHGERTVWRLALTTPGIHGEWLRELHERLSAAA